MSSLAPGPARPAETEGTLLGGRVFYAQKTDGHRTGVEPVLLAAFVPATPGQRVVEGGTGAGAGLLCLAARLPGVTGLGLEIDASLVALARRNVVANGHEAGPVGLHVAEQDVLRWQPEDMFDHAFANPPWHDAAGTQSPVLGKQIAKTAQDGSIEAWAIRLAAGLRRRGTLSLILPAAALAPGVAALRTANCPEIDVLPLWPRVGESARLVILRGVRNGGGAGRLLPGLVLHAEGGGYTRAAEDILRHAHAVA